MKVLAFGIAREILGSSVVAVPVEDAITVEQLQANLQTLYPAIKPLTSFMIAVNGDYAGPDTIIHAGDEVAIIPPVSGG